MFYKISKCVSRLNFTSAASWCVTLYEFFILVLHHSPQAFYIQLQICIVSIQGKVYWVNFYCISPIFCFYNLSSLELVQLYFPPFSLSCESFCHNLQWKVESPTTTQTFLNREKVVDAMMTILMAMMATQHCMSRFLRVDDSGKHHMPT